MIVIVAGVLGATGWYTWNSKNKTDKILAQAAAISQQAANAEKTQQTGGIKYSISVPASLKKQLQADYAKFKDTCSIFGSGPVTFDVSKQSGNFVQVDETCANTNDTAIYTLQNGQWVITTTSAGTYSCIDVDQYHITKQLVPTCYINNWDGSQTNRANTYP